MKKAEKVEQKGGRDAPTTDQGSSNEANALC